MSKMIDAIKKSIPKALILGEGSVTCPTCGIIYPAYVYPNFRYCVKCGQKFDLSHCEHSTYMTDMVADKQRKTDTKGEKNDIR